MSKWVTFLIGVNKTTGNPEIINIDNPLEVNENAKVFSDCNKTLGEILEQSQRDIVHSSELKDIVNNLTGNTIE